MTIGIRGNPDVDEKYEIDEHREVATLKEEFKAYIDDPENWTVGPVVIEKLPECAGKVPLAESSAGDGEVLA